MRRSDISRPAHRKIKSLSAARTDSEKGRPARDARTPRRRRTSTKRSAPGHANGSPRLGRSHKRIGVSKNVRDFRGLDGRLQRASPKFLGEKHVAAGAPQATASRKATALGARALDIDVPERTQNPVRPMPAQLSGACRSCGRRAFSRQRRLRACADAASDGPTDRAPARKERRCGRTPPS